MRKLLLIVPLVALTSCGTTPAGHVREGDPAKVSVGMTKEDLFKTIGRPESATKEGDAEILSYTLERPWWQTGRFRVKIVNDKVESYEVFDR